MKERDSGWNQNKVKADQKLIIKEFKGQVFIVNQRGETFEVSSKGSLGVLALGSLGHKAWKRAIELTKNNG